MMVVVKKEGIKVKHTRAYFSFFYQHSSDNGVGDDVSL